MKLCKVCDLVDWEDKDFQATLAELNIPGSLKRIHRKYWEFVMGVRGIKAFNKLGENAIALGIGSGTEPVMYYLANHIKHVYATDIYGIGSFSQREAQTEMLTHPAKYAPFPYREDHLTVEFMDGRYLLYDSNMFDIVFSFSSIEHFGSRTDIKQTMKEIGRVLKPGGIAVIATEIILNDQSHPEFFRRDELIPCLVEPSGLELAEDDIDFTISADLLRKPTPWEERESMAPHITLQIDNVVFTSIMLVLHKLEQTSNRDLLEIDKNLRLELSRLKLEQPQISASPPSIQINPNRLDKVPFISIIYRTIRWKFHELVVFYMVQLNDQFQQQLSRFQNRTIHLTEQLLFKSERCVMCSEFELLEAKVEALEKQLEALQKANALSTEKRD